MLSELSCQLNWHRSSWLVWHGTCMSFFDIAFSSFSYRLILLAEWRRRYFPWRHAVSLISQCKHFRARLTHDKSCCSTISCLPLGRRWNACGWRSFRTSPCCGFSWVCTLCNSVMFGSQHAENRYLSPLGYIVIIVCVLPSSFTLWTLLKFWNIKAFNDSWSQDVCNRYVLYPEALKCVTAFVIGGESMALSRSQYLSISA